jgi:hypothetical protein
MSERAAEPGLVTELRRAVADCGQSLNQLSVASGVDRGRLSRFMRGERDINLSAAGRVCEVLGLRLAPGADIPGALPPAAQQRHADPTVPRQRPRRRSRKGGDQRRGAGPTKGGLPDIG